MALTVKPSETGPRGRGAGGGASSGPRLFAPLSGPPLAPRGSFSATIVLKVLFSGHVSCTSQGLREGGRGGKEKGARPRRTGVWGLPGEGGWGGAGRERAGPRPGLQRASKGDLPVAKRRVNTAGTWPHPRDVRFLGRNPEERRAGEEQKLRSETTTPRRPRAALRLRVRTPTAGRGGGESGGLNPAAHRWREALAGAPEAPSCPAVRTCPVTMIGTWCPSGTASPRRPAPS